MRPSLRLAALLGLLLPAASLAQTPLAAPGQPGWTPAGNDCFVWNQNPNAGETANWSGPCENRRASGKGTLIWKHGSREQRYDGEMRDGKLNGHGIYSFSTAERYEGDFKDDQYDGTGTLLAGGDRYDGSWRAGRKNGKGVLILSDGTRFEGEFKDDSLEGQGSIMLANGSRYDGTLAHGLPDGQGTLTGASGTFAGTWAKGCFNDGKRKASFLVDPAGCK
jgi:hypothetical protein